MNISLAEWSALIEVGCPRLDAQHKELFALAAAFNGSGDEVRVMRSITILCEHVKVHFREEEELMQACGFPGYEAHRRQHDECRQMLLRLLDEARTMSLDRLAGEVRFLINGWIYNHILTADLEYIPYLRSDLADPQTLAGERQ